MLVKQGISKKNLIPTHARSQSHSFVFCSLRDMFIAHLIILISGHEEELFFSLQDPCVRTWTVNAF